MKPGEREEKLCARLDCQEQAPSQITLKRGEEETIYRLCPFHYFEALAVIRGVQITTGVSLPREEMREHG